MAKNVLPKHWNGSEFEELHIVTKASNVFTNDNKSVQQKIDDFTTFKETTETEIDNLKSSVRDGKIQVRDAITNKGGTVSDSDGDGVPTFQELVNSINDISTTVIKSVQHIQGEMLNTTYQDIKISAVNRDKSIIIISSHSGGYANRSLVSAQFWNDSTVRVRRRSSSLTSEYSLMVVEFEDSVSVQSGSFSSLKGLREVSISPVDLEKSIILFSINSDLDGAGSTSSSLTRAYFSNSSTITFDRSWSNGSVDVYWFVVEFP